MEVPSEILQRYLERRKQDLKVCLLALDRKNFPELEKIGHQLKGNASTFGHPELSLIGNKLEKSSKKREISLIEESIKELSRWLSLHVN